MVFVHHIHSEPDQALQNLGLAVNVRNLSVVEGVKTAINWIELIEALDLV